MKKKILILMTVGTILLPVRSFAFTDGSGWVIVSYLVKLLEESVRRYQQLHDIIEKSREAQDYMREINRGRDDLSRLLSTLPIKDENILGQLKTFQKSLDEVAKIYGAIPKSADETIQKTNDLAVAESLKMATNANEYAEKQELNAAMIETRSWDMSPKGAMRMQAQVSSQILLTLNQILKMNSQLLKMQSAQFATQNRDEKQGVLSFQKFSHEVASTSKSFSGDLTLPKF